MQAQVFQPRRGNYGLKLIGYQRTLFMFAQKVANRPNYIDATLSC